MSFQITTTTALSGSFNGFPFENPIQNTVFKLSNDNLVTVFIKDARYLHYAISTDDGESWTVSSSLSSDYTGVTAVQEGDNLRLFLMPRSTNRSVSRLLTYNSETNVYSAGSLVNITNSAYSGGVRWNPLVYWNSEFFYFPKRGSNAGVYLFYSDDITASLWANTSKSTPTQPRAIFVAPMADRLRVYVSESTKIHYSDITVGESGYNWSDWTELFTDTLDIYNAFIGHRVSDNEIYLAYRTTSGYKITKYNGTSFETAIQVSTEATDTYGNFSVVNGVLTFTYIKTEEQPDTSIHYGIYCTQKTSTGWKTELEIVPLSATPLNSLKTSPSSSTVESFYVSGSANPYSVRFNSFALPEGESINVNESLEISDSTILKPSIEYLNINEIVHLSEDIDSKVSNLYFTVDESLEVSDDVQIDSYRRVLDIEENLTVEDTQWFDSDEIINIEENIVISDEITTSLNKIDIYEEILVNDESFIGFPVILDSEEQIIVSDEVKSRTSINYPYQIIAFNPLIVVSKTNPIRISIINVDDLDNIDWDGATIIPGVSDFNNITYNTLNECVYIITDSGKIIKIPVSDLGNQETISVSLFPNLKDSTVLSNRLQLYSISDSNTGELILLDEREMKSVSLDIKYVQEKVNFIPLDIRSIHTKNMPLNIIVLETNSKSIGLSFSFLKYAFDDASQYPIDYTKIQVKINNVDMSVLNDVDMSSIVITHNIESDKSNASFNLYRRFDDLNTTLNNVTSQITNKNTVQIFINGVKEFDGKISNLNVHTENEIVSVTCVGNRPNEQKNVVRIPFSRLNTNLHLYDCLLSNITMDNPPLDPDDETPEYYLGVEVDLGIQRTQQVQRWISMSNALSAIEQGTFQAQQNWTYFWSVAVTRFWTDWVGKRRKFSTNAQYIGTSLSPAFSEDFKITYAGYKTQKAYPDTETHLGVYRIGQAPYLPISAPNGMYISKDRWEDRPNGLYRVTDASFNFVPVARNHAQIEYEKLKNINGDILPRTSADVEITLDAYYFYNIKLLSRLNFSNTTKDNIYNKQNGFPVSVKLIVISTSNMRVQLQTDNNLSTLEIDALEDKKYSTDNYEKDGSEGLENYKYDLVTGHKVV